MAYIHTYIRVQGFYFLFAIYVEKLSEHIICNVYLLDFFIICIYNVIIWGIALSHTFTNTEYI